jgi:thioredoxin-like negative regulator of GroEL
MTPIVNGLAQEFDGQVAVHQLNAAGPANIQVQSEYGLRGHPSFVVLDADGRSVQTFLGPQTKETLRQAITTVIR